MRKERGRGIRGVTEQTEVTQRLMGHCWTHWICGGSCEEGGPAVAPLCSGQRVPAGVYVRGIWTVTQLISAPPTEGSLLFRPAQTDQV